MESIEPMWYEIDFCAGDSGSFQADVRVPPDSPWFDGHFPGRPVLPGIAQLAMVQDLLARSLACAGRITAVHRVRFKQAVAPGAALTVMARTQGAAGREVAFRILDGSALVCSGIATLAHAAPKETV